MRHPSNGYYIWTLKIPEKGVGCPWYGPNGWGVSLFEAGSYNTRKEAREARKQALKKYPEVQRLVVSGQKITW